MNAFTESAAERQDITQMCDVFAPVHDHSMSVPFTIKIFTSAQSADRHDTARSMMIVIAGLCVLVLALFLFDVLSLIIVALLGIPAAVSSWRFVALVFAHETQLDAQLAAFQARWRARFSVRRNQHAYTGKTVKLDEV